MSALQLYGIEIIQDNQAPKSLIGIDSVQADSSISIENDFGSSGASWGMNQIHSISMDVAAKEENKLIGQYRELINIPEVDLCVEEITQEAVIFPKDGENAVDVDLSNLDDKKYSPKIKKMMREEFKTVYDLLHFNRKGHDIFKRWLVDSRINYHKLIDNDNIADGIQALTFIDPRKIKKVQESNRTIDPNTRALVINDYKEFFYYNENGIKNLDEERKRAESNSGTSALNVYAQSAAQPINILTRDSVAYAPSGINDASGKMVVGYLHKVLKTANNLQLMEDSMLIYKLSRAPERRVFYIDTGNLPKAKAEQYVKGIADKYRTKVVYDAKSGEIKNDRKFNALTEDFWLPRSGGCFSMDTKISLLDGRQVELGQLAVEHNAGKQNWTYSVDTNGHIVPGKITWAGVTQNNAEVIDVTLDNGEVITCTPEHKFILRNGKKVRADSLVNGSSLMPFNTRKKLIAGKEYSQVMHNDSEKFEFEHRMVSRYLDRYQDKTEVIHHIDCNRYNNYPCNLRIMDKVEHLKLHSTMGAASWNNGNYEEHCKNLSIAGKKFFNTEEGQLRKKEISEFNKQSELVWEGLKNARIGSLLARKNDKNILSEDEYKEKWCKNRWTEEGQVKSNKSNRIRIINERNTLTKNEFSDKYGKASRDAMKKRHSTIKLDEVIKIIESLVINDSRVSNDTILEHLNMFNSKKALRKYLECNGYNSISDVIVRNISKEYIVPKRLQHSNINNHKVVSVVIRKDLLDVGTLTIDGDNEFHDYHNFALSSGVFVMNSKGTEISTLPGGQNSGDTEETEYFKDKLFNALGVPKARFEEQSSMFSGGTQITRDEIRFSRLIERLRTSFNMLFEDILGTQLILKNIISPEDWIDIKNKIVYKYAEDNYFKEAVALERMQLIASLMQQYDMLTGKWVSKEFVYKNVAMFTEDEIREIKEQIANEEDTSQEKEIRSRQNDLALTNISAQEDELNNPAPPPAPPTVKAASNPPPKQNTAKRPGLTNTVEVSEAYDISEWPSLTEDVISEMF